MSDIIKRSSHIDTLKYRFVCDTFINTADQNYIACRTCFLNRIDNEMSWQAAHALEKYMKAVLVINDVSVKKLSHNLLLLYEELLKVAGDLLLSDFNEQAKELLNLLQVIGSPDSRYGLKGQYFSGDDIKIIDRMVFVLRRLFRKLKFPLLPGGKEIDQCVINDKSYNSQFIIPDSVLDTFIHDSELVTERGREIKKYILKGNDYFAPNDYEHGDLSIFKRKKSSQEPLLYMISHLPCIKDKKEAIDWATSLMKIPKESIPKIG